MSEQDRPKVGVSLMIIKDGKVLLGKRLGSHGAGQYAFPGGHLEYLESFATCAKREVAEECGIEVKNIRFQLLANTVENVPKHYVHVGLLADWAGGEPEVREPEKCESWKWYELDKLPEPIFSLSKLSLDNYKNGKNYFDISVAGAEQVD